MIVPLAHVLTDGQMPDYPNTITGYAEATAALHDRTGRMSVAATGPYFRRLVCHQLDPAPPGYQEDLLSEMRALILVYADGHRHARLRQVIRAALSTRVTGAAAGIIDETVDLLLDKMAPRSRMDVVRDLARPLPAIVITRLLGLPLDDLDRLTQWSDDLAAIVGPASGTPETLAHAQRGATELHAYLRDVIAAHRKNPSDDLISELIIRGEQSGLIEREAELIANLAFLLIAGHESTASLIASGVFLLLRHPDQLARVRADPSMLDIAVREALRLESPVQMVARTTVGGPRHLVRILVGQANRDPAAYARPDHFDIGRYQAGGRSGLPPHLAFGAGDHRCLGAALAVMEARSAISKLLRRFPDLALASDQIEWRDSLVFRSLMSLPCTFRPIAPV